MLAHGREAKDIQSLVPALKNASRAYAQLGRVEDARRLAAELLSLNIGRNSEALFYHHPIWPVAGLGITAEVRELFEQSLPTPWREAQLALLDEDFARAAEIYAGVGYRPFEAEIRLLAAEHLVATGRSEEGEAELEKALVFFRSVGATFYVERGEKLLASAQSESA